MCEFEQIADKDGLMFIDKINGMKVDDIITKYQYSKRSTYTHITKGRDKFIKYLEEKDVLLWDKILQCLRKSIKAKDESILWPLHCGDWNV